MTLTAPCQRHKRAAAKPASWMIHPAFLLQFRLLPRLPLQSEDGAGGPPSDMVNGQQCCSQRRRFVTLNHRTGLRHRTVL